MVRRPMLLVLGVLCVFACGCATETGSPLAPSVVGASTVVGSVGSATSTAMTASPRPAERCINFAWQGIGQLGIFGGALGAAPTSVVLGDIPGEMSSVITRGELVTSASHFELVHTFVSTDPNRPGTFTTHDRAVCAPAGRDPDVCRVNDVLDIASGTGIFENAGGSFRNHGVIDLTTFTLTIDMRGRVCGDGL